MRHTFLLADHDCGEELPVTIEEIRSSPTAEGQGWVGASWMCAVEYRLVSWPSICKCGRPIPLLEASQEDLRAAYALPESEEV